MAKYNNVNWKRYQALRDIRLERKFTKAERAEYETYLPMLKELDEEEAARDKPTLERLMRKHEETLASILNLTERSRKL